MPLSVCTGLLAMTALRAGAFHVTAVERWLYLSLACKEAMAANRFDDASYCVVYKRPTDLALLKDVPICCNLLVCDMFDEGKRMSDHIPLLDCAGSKELSFFWRFTECHCPEYRIKSHGCWQPNAVQSVSHPFSQSLLRNVGLLTSGLIPSMRHAIQNLMTEEMIVLPAAATVYVQAAEVRAKQVCGIDMAPLDCHRSHPAYLSGASLPFILPARHTAHKPC